MNIDRTTVVVGVTAAVAIALIAAVVPWHGGPLTSASSAAAHAVDEAGKPQPILQPITPSTWPYSQLAVLRQQRLSLDVMPESFTKDDDSVDHDSARLIATHGKEEEWIAVTPTGSLCMLYITEGEAGATSACTTSSAEVAPGALVMGGGFGDDKLDVYADGPVSAHEVRTGTRQIAPNVWSSGTWTAARPTTTFADPLAFPRPEPFASVALLRRATTAADTLPKSAQDSSSIFQGLLAGTVRYAGEFHGAKGWVGVNGKKQVCLIVDSGDGGAGKACETRIADRKGNGGSIAGLGAEGVLMQLLEDGAKPEVGADDHFTKLAPNVWASDTN